MLVKVHMLLLVLASNLLRIDSFIVDSRDSSNKIPQFNTDINDNFINFDQSTTESHPSPPQKPYKFEEQPEDIHVPVGSSITLACVVSHTNGTVQWTQDSFGLGVDRSLPGYKRYSMIGDENSGNYSLHIVDVNLKDVGFYQCQFSNQDIQMRSRYATVSVFQPVKHLKNTQICFAGIGDVGEAFLSEKYEASGSSWNGLGQIKVGFIAVMGFLRLII